MKITINKTAKRVLSVTLALAMILGTLFVANVGVTFDASAATVEDTWDGTKVEPTATDAQGNIIINTAEELAWIALQGGSATNGKNYKVADGIKYFNMNGSTGITVDSTVSDVKSATATTNLWNHSADFTGNFDGNGVVVYNIRNATSVAYGGLFPRISGVNTSIKNVTVKASIIYAYHGAGAILGQGSGQFTTTIDNCAVENCYMTDNNNTNTGCQRSAGIFVGSSANHCIKINNCFAAGNECSGVHSYGGFVGRASAWAPGNFTFTNCVSLGISPYTTAGAGAIGDDIAVKATWTNVYTDTDLPSGASTNAVNGIKKLTTAQMTGTAAKENMTLDFATTWFANTNGLPVLRVFHNVSANDNGDGTHSERCAECGLVGLTANHVYSIVDYITSTSSCACGVTIYGTSDVWDGTSADGFESGTGTKEDPYIIKTAEQLHLMVRSTGLDANGNQLYYKVDKSVIAFYLNETRSFASKDEFVSAAASLKNWSSDVVYESWCNCGKTHVGGYPYSFSGNFDGNGVTIYGLYSSLDVGSGNNAYDSRLPGVGFFTGLVGKSIEDEVVVKNVNFDMSYVENKKSRYVGVLTSSFGFTENNDTKNKGVHTEQRYSNNTVVKVANVSSRNTHIVTGDGSTGGAGTNAFASGIIAASAQPKSFAFTNCLFDGTNASYDMPVASGTAYKGGIFVTGQYDEPKYSIDNCLSIGAPVVITEVETTEVNRTMGVVNCYTTVDDNLFYDSICVIDDYKTIADMPLLNWTMWDLDAVAKYGTPMPKINTNDNIGGYLLNTGVYLSSQKQNALTNESAYVGYDWSELRGNNGVFNKFNELKGSGTEADPYIISDAKTLYLIIASGGTHFGVPQHFKLACNIDLGGTQWVDTERFANDSFGVVYYQYLPFEGTLDGDGHTIFNLYSADDDFAGFIPVLKGGTVKNLHFRNAHVASSENYAGVISGWMEGGSVSGCSAENSIVYSSQGYGDGLYIVYNDDVWTPDVFGTVTDCYYIGKNGDDEDVTVFFSEHNADDGLVMPEVSEIKAEILAGNTEYTSKWYLGADENAIPHLISNAKKLPCADIDGDGFGDEYTSRDVSTLKSNLLWKDGYDYIYGDVTANGKIDMRDLAALQRTMSGEDTIELDGFWPNVKTGKFSIYYDETDNYDFARKFELYLESISGLDIVKTMGTSNANFTVSIITDASLGINNYSSTYDVETAKLVIKGGSFTAVEEAVDKVIAETDVFGLPAQFTGTISTEKNSVTVDGKSYFYAWGDEFNNASNGTVSYDKWILRSKATDATPGDLDSEYENIRAATDDEARLINIIENGKLTLKRGFTSNDPDGYKYYMSGISSVNSMLFKQGYLEIKATVPADGTAFPAWWLLTHSNHRDNDGIDNSLFSKVFELNQKYDYNNAVKNPTPTDITTYKYKVPTQTLEIDLFEVIQKPAYRSSFSNTVIASTDNNVKFTIHKWYPYSTVKDDNNLAVYDLDWSKDLDAFSTKLLTATGATDGVGYTQQSASIKVHSGNLSTGSINGNLTESGMGNHGEILKDMSSSKNSSGQITERRYGFLWTSEKMVFMIEDSSGNMVPVNDNATVTVDDMSFGGESYYTDNYGFNQYAFMLLENHIFTSNTGYSRGMPYMDTTKDCPFVIDYVRIYQLDGARDIITPESESI